MLAAAEAVDGCEVQCWRARLEGAALAAEMRALRWGGCCGMSEEMARELAGGCAGGAVRAAAGRSLRRLLERGRA